MMFVSDIISDNGSLSLSKQIKKLMQKKTWAIMELSKNKTSKNKSKDRY